jgi:hypothetical protein
MFEKLLKATDTLSPSVTKLLHKAGLPVGKVSFKSKLITKEKYFFL